MKYNLEAQMKKYEVSFRTIQSETVSWKTQRKAIAEKCLDSDTVLLLHNRLGFDAPSDISEYMFSNILWTAIGEGYSYVYLSDNIMPISSSILVRMAESFVKDNKDRCFYEQKDKVDELFRSKGVYVKELNKVSLGVGKKISYRNYRISLLMANLEKSKKNAIITEISDHSRNIKKHSPSDMLTITKTNKLPVFYEAVLFENNMTEN